MNGTTGKCFCHLNGYEVKDAKAREAIEEVKSELSASKKYLFIGDSYMAHDLNIVDPCASVLGLTENDFYKYATGGFGFVSQAGTFKSLLLNAITDITNKDEIAEIIVCGGLNDTAQPEDTIISAINDFVTTAKASFTNAIIKIGFSGWWKSASHIGAQTGRAVMQYKKGAIKAGAFWLHGTEYAMHDYRMFSSDNVHPKDASVYNWLGQCLAQAIKTGKCSVNFVNYERAITPAHDFVISSTRPFSVVETVDDGMTTFALTGDFQITSANGVPFAFNSAVKLGTLNDGLVMGAGGTFNNSWHPVYAIVIIKNTGSTLGCNGYIYISDNIMYFVPTDPAIASMGSVTTSSIMLNRFTLPMPSTYC